ncbi:MAG: ATP-grasp domain-containing protein [Labilithrix sp.]|nr:ATP-grasp domain-containing protein [Labilithrix sp.]
MLLLTPLDPAPRPDTDLGAVTRDLLDSLKARGRWDVVHASITCLQDVETALFEHQPDVVFNACESVGGRSADEPEVPHLLERLGVPFTGSSSSCLRLCLDKFDTSSALARAGVPVPATYRAGVPLPASPFPLIVKPEREDGSVGIDADSVVHDAASLSRKVAGLAADGRPAVLQQYIDGREVALALLGGTNPRVLSPGEILYDADAFSGRPRILTYASKWDETSVDYVGTRSTEAALSPELHRRLSVLARRAAAALGMRDYGRIDFRVDRSGRAFVIDANPNCDLSRDGGFMLAAKRSGLDHGQVVATLVTGALARAGAPARAAAR